LFISCTSTTKPNQFGSNHGTYFYNQLASLQIIVGDINGAINTTKQYFSQQYMEQIDAIGEQASDWQYHEADVC